MLRRSAAVLAVIVSLGNINPSCADPGPVASWLIEQPASLLDLGILRLNLALNERWGHFAGQASKEPECITKLGCTLGTSADYLWQENRIRIVLDQYVAREISQDEVKEICRDLMGQLRVYGNVRENWGDYYSDHNHSSYAEYFSHYGYEMKSAPDNYLSRLDELIEFRVIVKALPEVEPELFAPYPNTVCTGPLLSNKVYFEE